MLRHGVSLSIVLSLIACSGGESPTIETPSPTPTPFQSRIRLSQGPPDGSTIVTRFGVPVQDPGFAVEILHDEDATVWTTPLDFLSEGRLCAVSAGTEGEVTAFTPTTIPIESTLLLRDSCPPPVTTAEIRLGFGVGPVSEPLVTETLARTYTWTE
jgi:hypothetical protein